MGDDATTNRKGLGVFQVIALVLAIVLTAAGGVGLILHSGDKPAEPLPTVTTPDNARSVVDSGPTVTEVPPADDAWKARWSALGARVGLSFLGGFAIGLATRTFLKTVAVLSALAICSAVALSYFGVVNVDLSTAREQWTTHGDWITEQAVKLRDVLWAYLPSSTAALAGAAVGLIRK